MNTRNKSDKSRPHDWVEREALLEKTQALVNEIFKRGSVELASNEGHSDELPYMFKIVLSDYSGDGFTFDKLALLSEGLGTKLINIGSAIHDDGYCDTCSNPYSAVEIFVKFKKS